MRRDGLAGGLLAYDGQLIDDARLVTAVARTAAQHGAQHPDPRGGVECDGHLGDADRSALRRVVRRVRPRRHQCQRCVGGGGGLVDSGCGPAAEPIWCSTPRRSAIPIAALTIPIPGEINRFVFAMPEQLGRVYLGLTDEDAPGPIPDVPQPTSEEISFLLDTVNTALDVALGPDDVVGSYAGLRPLIDTGEGRTADVSREHAVVDSPSGVISVIGGKLTEYRYMAEDVLDRAIALRGLSATHCRTRNLPLVGAPSNPVATLRSPAELPGSLVARYGAEAPNVIAAASCDRPTEPVADGIDVTRAEFEYAVTHEGALTVDDILDRRTRIGLVKADRDRVMGVAEELLAKSDSLTRRESPQDQRILGVIASARARELQRDVLVPTAACGRLGQRLASACCGCAPGRSSRRPRRSRWRNPRRRRASRARRPVPRAAPHARRSGAAASFFLCRMPTAALAPITATSASGHANTFVAPSDREFIAM